MTAPITVAGMVDDAAFLSLEHQLHLADVLGEHSWSVDLAAPRVEFAGANPLVCTAVHLLGTAADEPRSWLWSWARADGFAPAVTQLAHTVRQFGEQQGIAELASPEVPFHAFPDGCQDVLGSVAVLTDAAKAFSGIYTAYSGDAGGGTRAAFLIEHPAFVLPPPDQDRTLALLTRGVAELPLSDPRRALHSYAVRRALVATWSPDGTALTLDGPGWRIGATFDPLGRVGSLHAASPVR